MKARIKGTDEPFRDIETVEMKGVDGLYSPEDIEFELIPPDHWQDVRERAAIAAMHGLLSDGRQVNASHVIKYSIICADELIKKLKGE